jgi:hypothetical protein
MSEPSVQDEPSLSPPRRSWLRLLIVGAGLFLAALVGGYLYLDYAREREIRAAMAEADRLDPGWRFEDMEGARAPVPDVENGALLVRAAHAKMPGGWLSVTPGGGPSLEDRLAEQPSLRPDEADLNELRAKMEKVAAALDVARGLADRPRGRYDVAWKSDLIGTLMPHVNEAREVAGMLALDALLRSLDDDGEGAVRSCRAALNAGRSLGDEPAAVSQFVRAGCAGRAVRALEQVLAQGKAPAKSLEELQRLLEEEAEAPLELIAARSERVMNFQALETMRSGHFDRASYGLRSSVLGNTGDTLIDRGRAAACEAALLRHGNELVEIAKLPTEEQQERLKGLREPAEKLPTLLDALTRDFDRLRFAARFHRTKAELRCAAAALAAERYRMAEGRWPENLGALAPRYLAAVPADPFDGKPLRLRRLADGLVIYSVGADGADDGGNLDRKGQASPGTDVGFQLWDADRRGKPPAPK